VLRIRWFVFCVIVASACLGGRPAAAEQVIAAWRGGGFNCPLSVSVNPTDGSCWVADYNNNQVVHLAQNGAQLWRGGGFVGPHSVSVNTADGSCWVAESDNNRVVHLGASGNQLWAGAFNQPISVSVNPNDGSCWVTDTKNNQVVHLAQNGAQLWRSAGYPTFNSPFCVSVNPTDNSCWVTDSYNNQVVHLAENGAQLWRSAGYPTFNQPQFVSVNAIDSSCWVADTGNNRVVHLAASGTQLWELGLGIVLLVSVNAADGSCWATMANGNGGGAAMHFARDGRQWWGGEGVTGLKYPASVSVNPTDGSCWVGDIGNGQVVHLVVVNPVVLSSAYVTPTSGMGNTTFTWRVKYWNTDNAPPDQVLVAIWFPTLKRSYWYAMWPLYPSNVNYKGGVVYTFSRRWLPPGAYAYRFAARQALNWVPLNVYYAYWPSPAGSYRSGPTVSGP